MSAVRNETYWSSTTGLVGLRSPGEGGAVRSYSCRSEVLYFLLFTGHIIRT